MNLVKWSGALAALAAACVALDCGGATSTLGGGDAGEDATGSSGGGGSNSGSGSSGGGSNGSSGGSTSSGSGGNSGSSGGGSSTGSGGGSTSGSGGSSSSSGASSSGSGGGSTSGSGGGSGSSSGGPGCGTMCNMPGFQCCSNACVDTFNDPTNCGSCGHHCDGTTNYCNNGHCEAPPCYGVTCTGGSCCGMSCCDQGQICCEQEGPVGGYPSCYTPTAQQPTCPPGCTGCVSDRNVKRDIVPVDPQAVLDGLSRVPIATWSYKSDDPSVTHMGPMAQDFYGEFGLGNTDKAYSPIDAHGVAFAAIQALYDRVKEQDARLEKLEKENRELRRRLHK